MARAGAIREKLADMILDLCGEGFSIDPRQLWVNKGASRFNDRCSWTGLVYEDALVNRSNSYGQWSIFSYSTMTDLVKNGRICFLSGGIKDGEISEWFPAKSALMRLSRFGRRAKMKRHSLHNY